MSITRKRHRKPKRVPYRQWPKERMHAHISKTARPSSSAWLSTKHTVDDEERERVFAQLKLKDEAGVREINRFRRLKQGMVT